MGAFDGLVHVKRKLVTKEDPLYLHKVFGLSALISFVYRYYYVYNTSGTLGFDGKFIDWMTMAVHMALSASSIIFHVVAKRIHSRPMVIYEEYRLHAITFTARCVAVYIFGLIRPFRDTYLERVLLFATVIVWHLIADEITRRHGSKGISAVRCDGSGGLDGRSTSQLVVKYPVLMNIVKSGMKFYSFYQIAAVCTHLMPCDRTSDLGFNTVVAIQSSAFLMTLYRKSLIHQHTHAVIYSAALLLSLFHMYKCFPNPLVWARIFVVFGLRLLNINKYVLYFTFALVANPLMNGDVYGLPTGTAAFSNLSMLYPETWA
eukprot:TRINITY_DN8694_c0_g2_i2.p1 TRINITY_DN8694_c0_g2~~TRINITY_DN8694_c0_g2_i2.p1  ORF type:complete len:317 (-),score=32.71 TRINITY_DN8694_c0_g2_i2:212-1162(-)